MYEIKYFRKYLRSKVSCQLISENSRQGLHTIVQYIVYLCTKVPRYIIEIELCGIKAAI